MMKNNKRNSKNSKLYYIEQGFSVSSEAVELFMWKDACEAVRHYQAQHPEEKFVIREFEPI